MRAFRGDTYQFFLITAGLAAAGLFGVFFYRELFPEYKIYQNDYLALEKFRSTYSGQPIPPFKSGIQQIVMEKENKGPADIDRCTSCHVALQFEHFSPTKVARDVNGNIRVNEEGFPVQEKNENYVYYRLDKKIQELREKGDETAAAKLEGLKTAEVGEHVYDVTKVLKMHPLIGKETRPFEFHPIEEYGCTSCHNGNGRGLTTEKAHGPVFDGRYEAEFVGHKPEFLEQDEDNDPIFSKVFNSKPGHSLLFMTTPLYVNNLIEARCIQCHKTTADEFRNSVNSVRLAVKGIEKKAAAIQTGLQEDVQAFLVLRSLKKLLSENTLQKTISILQEKENNPSLSDRERESVATNIERLKRYQNSEDAVKATEKALVELSGDDKAQQALAEILEKKDRESGTDYSTLLKSFIETAPKSALAKKAEALKLQRDLEKHAKETQNSVQDAVLDQATISALKTDIDHLTSTYQRGRALFVAQGCYACHRIAGLSRAGVGPELTKEGLKYPWFIKESIVWPQADLKTSTMPNMHMDHEELEALTTFLLAQTGKRKSESETGHKVAIQEWEAGRKNDWEKPIPPSKLNDLRYSMTVFATEGCAACHRLKGFESSVGFAQGKEGEGSEWFTNLFPESIQGSDIVKAIDAHAREIDEKLISLKKDNALLDEIEKTHPGLIESYYSNFKYAARAKGKAYTALPDEEEAKQTALWKERVHKVLMAFIQEYGLGRLIGPRPNWSGVYRSDEWLMEHFRNPSALVARSIMPVFPFDDSKYLALTKMLDVIGIRNKEALREEWRKDGFNPEMAYAMLCSQCHGDFLQGNGPVADWIYPIPKNLRNANFLRNLTKERAAESIIHGVKGTPMPPWGEIGQGKENEVATPVLTKEEVLRLVDWMYSSLPGSTVIRGKEEIPKWNYTPEDAIKDLRPKDVQDLQRKKQNEQARLDISSEILYASLDKTIPATAPKKSAVDEIFDIVPHEDGYVDKKGYYIKRAYYTEENLKKGQALFDLNCAVCHGKDADGRGLRAQTMVDAKPRMLTNLEWLGTRDDLRLLRSIKYGVAGTSMTQWGDVTSGLQRMQLVMYIRTLSEEGVQREKLKEITYKVFDAKIQVLEEARSHLYPLVEEQIAALKEARKKIADFRANPPEEIKEGDIAALIAAELKAERQLDKLKGIDNLLVDLIGEIRQEKQGFFSAGSSIISMLGSGEAFDTYISLIATYQTPFTFKEGKINKESSKEIEKEREELKKSLLEQLELKITNSNNELTGLRGKVKSADTEERISELAARIGQYRKLINKISYILAESSKREEREVYDINAFNEAPLSNTLMQSAKEKV
ncbi:cytochrome c [Estrella lausannensis]|uniref:Conserved putative membrane protein n=1 Tax=Estrella lausannensis TaxID=483423 RepID=A0A0H5DMW4_9BACT|nr:c-type cytochrome [Estrella lausannensis]CRX37521.1 Conserved putative membrane protein [Estrella lausannensis]